MRRIRLALLSLFVLGSPLLFAEGGPLGVGLVVGEPTGVSAAYRFDDAQSVQALVAWKLTSPGGVLVAADYLFHFDDILEFEGVRIPLYAGAGAKVAFLTGDARYKDSDSAFGLGLRIPLGVRWEFDKVPVEVFLEVVPGMLLLPGTIPDIGAGLGARWYF